jgi:hypothetical protein
MQDGMHDMVRTAFIWPLGLRSHGSGALCALRFAVLHTNNLIPWGIAFSFYDDACVVGLRKKDTDRNMCIGI